MTTIAAATQLTTPARSHWSFFVVDSSKGGHCQEKWRSMATAAMVVFIDSGHCQWRQQWDGGTMTQLHHQQWFLWPTVVAAMVVVVDNCAEAVDAAATIPSLVLMAAAKTPSPPPPSTTASIEDNCYC
jgi:hypothetical protein